MIRPAAFAFALIALPAAAQEAIEAPGLLADDAFYRAVACAAPPGGDCRKPFARWDASRPIRVALRAIDPAYLGRRAKVAASALKLGLRALNAAEAGFRLAQVPSGEIAEIEVWFLGLERGAPIVGTGIAGIDGTPLDSATTRVMVNPETGQIERAAIVFSATLDTAALAPAMLGELTKAMGLMTAIKGPAYDGISVLAQGSAATNTLGLQDIMALKRLYSRTGSE